MEKNSGGGGGGGEVKVINAGKGNNPRGYRNAFERGRGVGQTA